MNFSKQTILLTGASGFLGKYIKSQINTDEFNLITIGRKKADILYNLGEEIPKLPSNIDYLIHAAGQAHIVPKTKKESDLFFSTNYIGTQSLLEGLKQSGSKIKSIIFISSVSVYGLVKGKGIDENYPLSASDPYGKSKIMAEDLIMEFCTTNNISYCILRLPLIAGKKPPGNLGSMINAIKKGFYFSIGKADVKKSIVMAEDVASILASLFTRNGTYNLTDGYHPTFDELERGLAKALRKKKPLKIPQSVANFIAKIGDKMGNKSPINSSKLNKIQSELTFSDKKAVEELGWKPMKVIDNLDKII